MTKPLDLAAARARLSSQQGKHYWRSLEELADTEGFRDLLDREFPRLAPYWPDGVTRRRFLQLMAASLALAGLSGCTSRPLEHIVPYVKKPEEIIPGKPLFFATTMPFARAGLGVLVESHEGRPTKVEGNPNHPASLGATDAFAQASTLMLYDPDRSQAVINKGRIRPYDQFIRDFRAALDTQRGAGGAGIRILTETVVSPALANELSGILQAFPGLKWYQYEPINRDNVRAGTQLAFGQPVEPLYRFDRADVILSLDSDWLLLFSTGHVRYGHDFASRRQPTAAQPTMNRLYVVESTPTITGAKADHRLPMRASDIEAFARALAGRLGIAVTGSDNVPQTLSPTWLDALVRDLQAHRSSSLILAGDGQPAVVHALVAAMNEALGNVGNTIVYTDPLEPNPVDQTAGLRELVGDMEAGRVQMLVIAGGNPVYTVPADIPFADAMSKVGFKVHLSLYQDETSALADWHVPQAHYLESWGDIRAFEGTVSIIQPLIAPLYGGKSIYELLAAFSEDPLRSGHDIVKGFWQGQVQTGDFETFWRTALHDGIIPNTALAPRSVTVRPDFAPAAPAPAPAAGGVEIVFQPDPSVYDGRFANVGWLQELPKPLTKLTWDNAALISPAMAEREGLADGDVVELKLQDRTVHAPILILPGHPDNSVTVNLGYGRSRVGHVGNGLGFNAYAIRPSGAPWFATGLQIQNTETKYPLARTQAHFLLEGRDLVKAASLEEFRANPNFVHEGESPAEQSQGQGTTIVGNKPEAGAAATAQPGGVAQEKGFQAGPEAGGALSLYPEWQYKGYAWGMTIDMNLCIGCNACVAACQAENNIPVVGKTEVMRSREMHWLKIDHYYEGSLDNPTSYFQPRPCMHCENAPCEPVCPVGATVHSSEGINDMVYNRCVGTRYCSNNCPYKVRRFNFLQHTGYGHPLLTVPDQPVLKLLQNPNVTVRSRGVMEKCTYCIQRITLARTESEKEGRPIRDGDVVTACAAACPTNAIVFGNINDPNAVVTHLKSDSRNYALLAEVNTRPRTTYLAAVRNPNPEIPQPA